MTVAGLKYIKPSETKHMHAFKEKQGRVDRDPHVIVSTSAPASPSAGTLRLPRPISATILIFYFHTACIYLRTSILYIMTVNSSTRVHMDRHVCSSSIRTLPTESIAACTEMIASQSQPCHEKSSLCIHMKHQSHL